MKKNITKSLLAVMAVLTVFAFADVANAQTYRVVRQRQYTRASVDSVIRRVENRTDRFVKQFDKSLDRSVLDGSRREDNLNQSAKNLESATDELRREFNRHRNYLETRQNVQRCLSIGANINTAMRNRRFNRVTENNWRNLRNELNALARVYNLSPMGAYR